MLLSPDLFVQHEVEHKAPVESHYAFAVQGCSKHIEVLGLQKGV